VEGCLLADVGAQVTLPANLDPFVALFSESSARVLLGVSRAHAQRVAQLCSAHRVPLTRLGEVHPTPTLDITPLAPLTLTELRTAWDSTLPALFGIP
jgi:phosphoribosylformylglycinamidine (FGAM) synthase-like enzyme